MAPMHTATWVVSRALRPRPLAVCFFGFLVWPAAFHCLRPPLSHDVSGFELPLFGEPMRILQEGENPLTTHGWVWLSPGVLVAGLAVLCALAVLVRIERFAAASGIMLAGWLVCDASLAINQPIIVEQMDRQLEAHTALRTMLLATAHPEVDIMAYPRYSRAALHGRRGGILRGFDYFPVGRSTFLALAFFGVVLGQRSSLRRRLGLAAVWIVVGLLAAGIVCGRRLTAEWYWQRAVIAEANGDLYQADAMYEHSLRIVPALKNLERTWALRGLIDFQRGRRTPAARYFVGTQWARNGRLDEAISEFERLVGEDHLVGSMQSWHADAIADLALQRFRQGSIGGAEKLYRLANEIDVSLPERQLAVAVMLSHRANRAPDQIAGVLDPLLPKLADRALRASLLAMLGDSYFEAGEFAQARRLYHRSLSAFSLPKSINYRALRGLVGI